MCRVGGRESQPTLARTHAIENGIKTDIYVYIYIIVRYDPVCMDSLWQVIYSLNYIKSYAARRIQLAALSSPINSGELGSRNSVPSRLSE